MLLLASACVSGGGGLIERIGAASTFTMNMTRTFTTTFPKLSHSKSAVSANVVYNMGGRCVIRCSFVLNVPTVVTTGVSRAGSTVRVRRDVRILPAIVNVVATVMMNILYVGLLR